MNQFQISTATFYRYFRASKTFGLTIEDVLSSLRSQGFINIFTKNESDESGLPSILMVTCEAMI